LGNKLKSTNNVKLDGFGTFAIKEKTVNVNGLAQNNNYIKFKPSTKIKPKKD
jgi:nucleoid DNA-binding protein